MAKRLYVGNLPYSVSEDDLRRLFSTAGTVVDVHLPVDRQTGRPRGFAFVEMSSDQQANQAISQFNGTTMDGRQIRVNVAEERQSATR